MKLFRSEKSTTIFDPTGDTDVANNWWEEQSRYKPKEPGVIDSILLTQLVFDQGPKDYGLILAKEEGIDFSDVLRLRISFKNILKIASLWNFTNLVKLQLDNNSISKIEGISHMINLEWLDLSFNVITKIENLDNLEKLKDLTLFHNQIQVLENMDDLKSLEIFSIGKNNLKDLDNVMYLRNFTSLKSVNLVDNPMTSSEDYRLLMLVYVPQLKYIDYSLVNDDQREKAKVKFENIVLKLEAKDEVMQTEQGKKDKEDRKLSYFRKSFLEDFADEKLVGVLLHEDDEDSKLKLWWIIEKLFADEIQGMAKELFEFGLQQHEAREEELSSFKASMDSLINISTEFNIMKIDRFLEYKRKLWSELDTLDLEGFNETKSAFNKYLDELFNCLVREELHMVEDVNDIISQLELNLTDMVMSFKTHIHTKISSIRERANQFYEDLLQEANNLAEKKRRPDEFDEIPGEIMHLAGDKMLLTVTIQTCHDQRLAKIDYIQDHIYHRLNNYVPNIIDELHERLEVKRNRERIQEICHFVEFHRTDGEHVFDLLNNLMA